MPAVVNIDEVTDQILLKRKGTDTDKKEDHDEGYCLNDERRAVLYARRDKPLRGDPE